MRIVSLLPSATEIICALGFQEHLVGRSHECDFPPGVEKLPACCQPKFKPIGSSLEIHDRVKDIVRQSLSIYEIKTEILKQANPDLIITQDHCDVCAVSLDEVEQAVCRLLDSNPAIITLTPDRLEDVWKGIQQVAEGLGAAEKGKELVEACQRRMREISKRVPKRKNKLKIVCVEWFDPLMVAANWMPELIEIAGAEDLFGRAGEHAPRIKWEQIAVTDPDVIVMMPCGWDVKKSREEAAIITGKPGWRDLNAVKNGRVYLTDSNQYFNRPGPRLVDSLEILCEIFYPEVFEPRHLNEGWQPL